MLPYLHIAFSHTHAYTHRRTIQLLGTPDAFTSYANHILTDTLPYTSAQAATTPDTHSTHTPHALTHLQKQQVTAGENHQNSMHLQID